VALSSGGTASAVTTTLTVGPHSITAEYSGDGSFNVSSGGLTQTVNKADTTTTVTSSAKPAMFGQAVTVTAAISVVAPCAATPTERVLLTVPTRRSSDLVALSSGGTASAVTTTLTVGPHSITAEYSGDGSFNVSSGGLTQTVNKADTTTTVTSSA